MGSFEDGSVTFQSVSKTRQRLAPIKILMLDEISMLGAKMLHKVNRKCNKIWSTATTSDSIMDGLPIVIFLGDFNQFEPVKLPCEGLRRPQRIV